MFVTHHVHTPACFQPTMFITYQFLYTTMFVLYHICTPPFLYPTMFIPSHVRTLPCLYPTMIIPCHVHALYYLYPAMFVPHRVCPRQYQMAGYEHNYFLLVCGGVRTGQGNNKTQLISLGMWQGINVVGFEQKATIFYCYV